MARNTIGYDLRSGYRFSESEHKLIDGLIKLRKGRTPEPPRTLPSTVVWSRRTSCGHEVKYVAPPPQPGDVVYCRECSDYREVTVR